VQTKQQIPELVDRLPESETGAAARYLEFLLAQDEAPIDAEMLKRIDAARTQQGSGIPMRKYSGNSVNEVVPVGTGSESRLA